MKRYISIIAILLLPLLAGAQATVTVVRTDGTTVETTVQQSGEVIFGTDYMAILPSSVSSTLITYQMDEVQKVLFSDAVRIISVDGDNNLMLAPNPAGSWFALHGLGSEPQTVTIYTLGGSQVLQGRYADGERIETGHLAAGIYLVRTNIGTTKLIIK